MTDTVTITMSVMNSGEGSITAYRNLVGGPIYGTTTSSMIISVPIGNVVAFQALATVGFVFDHFAGLGVTTTQNPFTATVTSSGYVYAYFKAVVSPSWDVRVK